MLAETPLHYKTIGEVAPLLKSKKLSPVELTQAQFARINKLDGRLQAYARTMEAKAKDDARAAEKEIAAGKYRGPLHGVPVAVKDLCFTKDIPTMGGSAALRDFIPDYDATVVSRLRQAGAVITGKLNLTEGAMASYNPALKDNVPFNPWDEKLSPGGSSSGSGVATASGMCYASLGTDTGGSIRFPSACNGVVGIKPTWGRVSRYGVLDLAQSLDHVGPMARSVADAALVLQAIAGPDNDDPTTLATPMEDLMADLGRPVRGVRVGYDEGYATEDVNPHTAKAVAAGVEALRRSGATVVRVKVPDLRPYLPAWHTICTAEALAAHSSRYPAKAAQFGPWFRSWLESGSKVTGADYARAMHLRLQAAGLLKRTFEEIDVLACPSMPTIEPRKTDKQLFEETSEDWDPYRGRFTAPYNFTGQPTISLPAGFSPEGAPLSLQLVGKHMQEALLVKLGAAFEQGTEHHRRHPDM
jgi:amidase